MDQMNVTSKSDSLKCSVCGDKAIGINWNAYTCVSCRNFFLRNSTKYSELKCRKNNENCSIDITSRVCCPKCRLIKCLQVGMKHHQKSTKKCSENNINYLIENCVKQNIDFDCNRIVNHQNYFSLHTLVRRRNYATDLNGLELGQINHVQNAMINAHFVDERTLPLVGQPQDLIDVINYPSNYAKQIVRFCRNIQSFKSLNRDDQVQVLKLFFMDCLFVEAGFVFDREKRGFPVIQNESATETIFVDIGACNIKEICKFLTLINREIHNDSTLRDLIMAQILFRNCQDASCAEYLRHQYFVFSRLVWRHLVAKYKNINIAKQKFVSLQSTLKQLDRIRVLRSGQSQVIDPLVPVWLGDLYKN